MASMIERETIINFNAAEKEASVWSCDPTWINKIKKLPEARENQNGWEAIVPKSWIKITKPREISAKQKAALAKNLALARKTKKGK